MLARPGLRSYKLPCDASAQEGGRGTSSTKCKHACEIVKRAQDTCCSPSPLLVALFLSENGQKKEEGKKTTEELGRPESYCSRQLIFTPLFCPLRCQRRTKLCRAPQLIAARESCGNLFPVKNLVPPFVFYTRELRSAYALAADTLLLCQDLFFFVKCNSTISLPIYIVLHSCDMDDEQASCSSLGFRETREE